jgi:hypothetical protein
LDFPFAAGPRISLTALDCEGWGVEANYFGIDGWSAENNLAPSALPGGTANLVVDSVSQALLTDAHFESIARFYSTELNFRRPLFGTFSLLAGFRWLDMTDQYSGGGTSAITGNNLSETITTRNHLFGSQLGVDGTLAKAKEGDRWRITGFVKAGTFLNIADQSTSVSDPADNVFLAASNNTTCLAFFGETGIVGYFQITKHLSASAGYEVMFVNNVAQPANQLAGMNLTTSSATVDTSSGLFYHGASAGLELTW